MSVVVTESRAAQPAAAPITAIANVAASIALFSLMDVLVKWLSADYSIVQLMFFRSVVALVPLGVWLAHSGAWADLRTSRPGAHVARSLVGLASMGAFFLAMSVMPIADVVAVGFAGPLFLTMLSIPLLGEKVGPRRWAAVLVGFLGVLLIVRPGTGVFGPEAVLPLFGALGFAFAMILVRRLSRTDSTAAIVFYFSLVGGVASGLALPFFWVWPTAEDWLALVAVGLIGGVAQIFMTQAFRLSPASSLAPFKYTSIIWAIGLGYVVFGDMPDHWTLAGASVVVASGLYILHRETLRRSVNAEDRPAAAHR